MDGIKVYVNRNQPYSTKDLFRNSNVCINLCRESIFMIKLGSDSKNAFLSELEQLDRELYRKQSISTNGYLRCNILDRYISQEKYDIFTSMYDVISATDISSALPASDIKLPFKFDNLYLENTCKNAFCTAVSTYINDTAKADERKRKSIAIVFLNWIDLYFGKLFLNTKKNSDFPFFIYTGPLKIQEFYFMYFLALCGCDVLYINPCAETEMNEKIIEKYSAVIKNACSHNVNIPLFNAQNIKNTITIPDTALQNNPQKVDLMRNRRSNNQPIQNTTVQSKVNLDRPARNSKTANNNAPKAEPMINQQNGNIQTLRNTPVLNRSNHNKTSEIIKFQKLEYEDLAKMASSVVMISVIGTDGTPFKSGSGVYINENGYILTNFHVACGASAYIVKLEEDDTPHVATIIKCHAENDLALLHTDVKRAPVHIYDEPEELVRGQKIVAIGSPLGLFNTVSNGIISGFRNLEGVPMIQFTAPVSPGSSGGCLLDMYGRLVGIITCLLDAGQNLNMAVDCKTVKAFLHGFI